MISLAGKVGIVTGASSGIGQATSILFSKLGANLALVGRNEENLTKTADECRKNGSKVVSIIADVTSTDDLNRIVDQTVKEFHQIDILVNNAGIAKAVNNCFGTIENTTMENFNLTLNVNLMSAFQIMQLSIPHLEKTKGTIVNVSSIHGMRSFPGSLAYNVSKAALDQLTKCSALELAPKGIRVNSVNPGNIVTDFQRRSGMDEAIYTKATDTLSNAIRLNESRICAFLERSKTTHPLGRAGDVDEVAQAIAYLASDASSFCTGHCLPVDGGRHATCAI